MGIGNRLPLAHRLLLLTGSKMVSMLQKHLVIISAPSHLNKKKIKSCRKKPRLSFLSTQLSTYFFPSSFVNPPSVSLPA